MRYVLTMCNKSCMNDHYWMLNPKMTLAEIKRFSENRVKPNSENAKHRGKLEKEDYTLPPNVDDTHILKWKKFKMGYYLFYTRPLRETDRFYPEDWDYDEELDDDGKVIRISGWDQSHKETYTSHEFTIWDTFKMKDLEP